MINAIPIFDWLRDRRQRDRRRVNQLLGRSATEMPAAAIAEITGLSSGRLYPALIWLEQNGNIISRFEDGPKPRRRLYQALWRHDGK